MSNVLFGQLKLTNHRRLQIAQKTYWSLTNTASKIWNEVRSLGLNDSDIQGLSAYRDIVRLEKDEMRHTDNFLERWGEVNADENKVEFDESTMIAIAEKIVEVVAESVRVHEQLYKEAKEKIRTKPKHHTFSEYEQE